MKTIHHSSTNSLACLLSTHQARPSCCSSGLFMAPGSAHFLAHILLCLSSNALSPLSSPAYSGFFEHFACVFILQQICGFYFYFYLLFISILLLFPEQPPSGPCLTTPLDPSHSMPWLLTHLLLSWENWQSLRLSSLRLSHPEPLHFSLWSCHYSVPLLSPSMVMFLPTQ